MNCNPCAMQLSISLVYCCSTLYMSGVRTTQWVTVQYLGGWERVHISDLKIRGSMSISYFHRVHKNKIQVAAIPLSTIQLGLALKYLYSWYSLVRFLSTVPSWQIGPLSQDTFHFPPMYQVLQLIQTYQPTPKSYYFASCFYVLLYFYIKALVCKLLLVSNIS